MKEIEVTVWERVKLAFIVGSQERLTASGMRSCLRLLDKLELQQAEKDRLGWTEMEGKAIWRDTGLSFTLEFEDEDFEALRKMVTGFTGWRGDESRKGLALLDKFEDKEV